MGVPIDMKAYQIAIYANALEIILQQLPIEEKIRTQMLDLASLISRDAEELSDELDPCSPNSIFPPLYGLARPKVKRNENIRADELAASKLVEDASAAGTNTKRSDHG